MRRGLAGLVVAVLALACGSPPPEETGSGAPDSGRAGPTLPVLAPIPELDLDRLASGVAGELRQRRAVIDELRHRLEPPSGERSGEGFEAWRAELGAAFASSAELYHAYGLLEAAAAGYRNAIALGGGSARWHYLLANVEQRRGAIESAAEHLEAVLEMVPEDLPALLRLGELRLEQGRADLARPLFERALERPGGEALARFGLGRVAALEERHREAVGELERVLELEPRAARVPPLLALSYRQLGELDEARRQARRAGDRELRIADPLLAELDRLGSGQGFLLSRAEAALLAGQLEESIRLYREAVAADPEDVESRHSLASALARAGQPGAGIAELRQALLLDPAAAILHRKLGLLLAAAGRLDEAVEACERAVRLDPGGARNRLGLARVLAQSGQPAAALEEYDAALELDPESAEARVGRVWTLVELGARGTARAELEAAVEREPSNAVYHLHLADLLARGGGAERATAHYRRAIELAAGTGERVHARVALARLALADGDFTGAEAALRAALEEEPGNAEAHFRLGQLLARSGAMEHAVPHFTAVLAREPQHEEAWLLETTGLVLLERYREARRRLEAALEAVPDSRSLAHSLARLLATCPEQEVRDGARALELANALLGRESSLEAAETVAMALAEAGRFSEAAAWQERILVQARPLGDATVVARLEGNLDRYRRRQPVRAPWRGPPPPAL